MYWRDYSKEKPKERGQYLIMISWHPEITVYDIATWDGKKFMRWNTYTDNRVKVEDVRYWCEIEDPRTSLDKAIEEYNRTLNVK